VTDRDELAGWLRLLETPGVGRESARRLLLAFGSPQAVLAATTEARRAVVGPAQAAALAAPPDTFDALLARTRAWLAATDEVPRQVITLADPEYPPALLASPDPPLLLYAQGQATMLARDSIAIVGSRNPSRQGLDNARAFGAHLSQAGWVVVSGLALGIDGAAHEGGLEGGAGTIAVVGTGLDRVYPARHRDLAQRIVCNGLIVGEYALGTPPLPANFPRRNRIIAGLSRGTLVVEATLQSGSLVTARLAAEAGREVFAIPGSIHAPQSRGCHALIRQGAKLVETAQDVFDELGGSTAADRPRPVDVALNVADSQSEDPLLTAMGYDPIGLDALEARTGWSAAMLSVRLLELELDGRVARLPGQLFQRTGQA